MAGRGGGRRQGLATLFERNTEAFDAIEPDLTIQGLAMLWDRAHMEP